MAKKVEQVERAVIVTTEHRGVFFGYTQLTDKEFETAETIKLDRARNCVYWSTDCKGFMGLASRGPTSSCRVGPSIPAITLRNITSILEVSPEAVSAWEKSPWN